MKGELLCDTNGIQIQWEGKVVSKKSIKLLQKLKTN